MYIKMKLSSKIFNYSKDKILEGAKYITSAVPIKIEERSEETEETEEIIPEPLNIDKLSTSLSNIIPYPNNSHAGIFSIADANAVRLIHNKRWELNREIDNNHVKELYEIYSRNLKEGKNIPFYDNIHVAYNKDTDELKILEGQHRITAIGLLLIEKQNIEFKFPLVLWFVDDDNDMMHLLHIINNRKIFEIEKHVSYELSDILTEFSNRFHYMDGSKKCDFWGKLRPHIDKDKFILKIRAKLDHINANYQSVSQLIDKLEKINLNIRQFTRKTRGGSKMTNDKAEKWNFFLGMDKDMEWINEI